MDASWQSSSRSAPLRHGSRYRRGRCRGSPVACTGSQSKGTVGQARCALDTSAQSVREQRRTTDATQISKTAPWLCGMQVDALDTVGPLRKLPLQHRAGLRLIAAVGHERAASWSCGRERTLMSSLRGCSTSAWSQFGLGFAAAAGQMAKQARCRTMLTSRVSCW